MHYLMAEDGHILSRETSCTDCTVMSACDACLALKPEVVDDGDQSDDESDVDGFIDDDDEGCTDEETDDEQGR